MDGIDDEMVPILNINRTQMAANISLITDIDLSLDGTVDGGVYDNFSYLTCADINYTYINVTCEATFEYSSILLGT